MNFKTDSGITNELIRLANMNDGLLTPAQVIIAARNPNSLLHASFDWNDTAAAKKWRLHQARNMLRVCVWYDESNRITEPIKVFVSLTTDRKENEGYRIITDVLTDEEYKRQMLADALDDLNRFRHKYAALQELASVFREIKMLMAKRVKR